MKHKSNITTKYFDVGWIILLTWQLFCVFLFFYRSIVIFSFKKDYETKACKQSDAGIPYTFATSRRHWKENVFQDQEKTERTREQRKLLLRPNMNEDEAARESKLHIPPVSQKRMRFIIDWKIWKRENETRTFTDFPWTFWWILSTLFFKFYFSFIAVMLLVHRKWLSH